MHTAQANIPTPLAATVTATPAAIQAFQEFYASELDARVQRSEVVGLSTLEHCNAALFYEHEQSKFTLVEKKNGEDTAHVIDCKVRFQWGRNVFLFGHATVTGGFIACGHGTLDDKRINIKLASGQRYSLEADPELPHLQPFIDTKAKPQRVVKEDRGALEPRENGANTDAGERSRPKKTKADRPQRPKLNHPTANEQQVHAGQIQSDGESEDFTEEDLMRLRGEMPLQRKSNAKRRR